MFKILIETDGFPSAQEALKFASDLCHHISDCEVTVIHVLDTMMLASAMAAPSGMAMPNASGIFSELQKMSAQLLEEARGQLGAQGVKAITCSQAGPPARVICDVAENEGFRLVIRGHSGTGRATETIIPVQGIIALWRSAPLPDSRALLLAHASIS